MKKIVTVSAFLSVIALSTAWAQTTQTAQPATTQESAESQTSATDPSQAGELMETQKIPFSVIRDSKTDSIEARIADLRTAASDIGINQMVITGKKEEVKNADGSRDIRIIWDRAYRMTEEGDRKDTVITAPLESEIQVIGDLKSGDQFAAEGSAMELLAAWDRLKTDEEKDEEDKEEVEKEDVAADNSPGGGVGSDQPDQKSDFESPDFAVAENPEITVTTDGCSVRVDIQQMVAVVQERTLEDGQEIAPCEDTLTRYPLEKAFSSCPLVFDTDAGNAYEQYVLSYNDPTSGQIEVQGCTQDDDRVIAISEDFEGCGLYHDFGQQKSFIQSKLTYFYQGAKQTLQDCSQTDEFYTHEITENTCNPIVNEDTVTFQNRVKIDVDGTTQYLSDCEPDASTTTAVLSEACQSPRYTHDFDSGQSYLNKNYYYMKDGSRVNVGNCVQSTTSFVHNLDETECSASNDDTNKETTLYARTYIEETSGNKTFISTCNPVAPKIPYVANGEKWAVSSSTLSSLALSSTDSQTRSQNYKYGNSEPYWSTVTSHSIMRCSTYKVDTYNRKICILQNGGMMNRHQVYVSTQNYCFYDKIAGSWETQSGITISKAQSTQDPSWTTSINSNGCSTVSNINSSMRRISSTGDACYVSWTCTQPQCQLTNLRAHPVWLRGDGTEWLDTSVTAESLYVCGDGSNLAGEYR